MSDLALKVEGLSKSFEMGGQLLPVLRGIDLEIGVGERVAIVGQSGSGKSTFLHVIGTLDQPTEGRVFLEGIDAFARADAELDTLRNRHIGFVFQFHHLLPDQDAVHNVMIPALIGGMNPSELENGPVGFCVELAWQTAWITVLGSSLVGSSSALRLHAPLFKGLGSCLQTSPRVISIPPQPVRCST